MGSLIRRGNRCWRIIIISQLGLQCVRITINSNMAGGGKTIGDGNHKRSLNYNIPYNNVTHLHLRVSLSGEIEIKESIKRRAIISSYYTGSSINGGNRLISTWKATSTWHSPTSNPLPTSSTVHASQIGGFITMGNVIVFCWGNRKSELQWRLNSVQQKKSLRLGSIINLEVLNGNCNIISDCMAAYSPFHLFRGAFTSKIGEPLGLL